MTERMETVLRNLFENACLYSPGSPEIRVTLAKERAGLLSSPFRIKGKG